MPLPTRRLALVVAVASIVVIGVGNGIAFVVVNTILLVAAVVDAVLARPGVGARGA